MQSELKAIKKVRWNSLKIPVFLGLLAFVAWRLSGENWEKAGYFPIVSFWPIVTAFLLIFINQGCEWYKWQLTARHLVSDTGVIRRSFMSGISTGFVTPNGWGNFLGRMAWFRKRDRMYIVLASLLSSFSQLLPTVLFGALAAILSPKIPFLPALIVCVMALLLIIAFFFGEYLAPRKPLRNRFLRHLQLMQQRLGRLRGQLFGWSILRYGVFSLQYLLLFRSFGHDNWIVLLPGIWLVFLLTSFVPSLWSGKVIIRETAAIFVFNGTGIPVSHIVAVTLLIWLFNHIVPALVSTLSWLPGTKNNMHHVTD